MSFASKVLDLSSLPQGSRSHYEKLLHERHWTVGHNSSKEATTSSDRQTVLTCSLCSSILTAALTTHMITFFVYAPILSCMPRQGTPLAVLPGLQYKHVQNWSPAMISEAYNCLVTMWTHHHTPDAWKWKWLVPSRRDLRTRFKN